MSFSPPIVGCLLNKSSQSGGGGGGGGGGDRHPRTPLAAPLALSFTYYKSDDYQLHFKQPDNFINRNFMYM